MSEQVETRETIIEVGKTYRIDDYQAVCIAKEDGICLMQTLGMTAGKWPGEGDIHDYDDRTKEFYQKWSPAISDMRLLSKEQAEVSNIALDALKKAVFNYSSFGAENDAVWLGAVVGSSDAWCIYHRYAYGDSYTNDSYVVAPAFNLEESKIFLDRDRIKLISNADYQRGLNDARGAAKKIILDVVHGETNYAELRGIKTSRHFRKIAEVLKQMQEGE